MANTTNDIDLINNIKNKQCEHSLQLLIEKYHLLSYKTLHKYASLFGGFGITIVELLKERDRLIYEAAISYKISKNTKFSTWLVNVLRYFCLNLLKDYKPYVSVANDSLTKYIDTLVCYNDPEHGSDFELTEYLLEQVSDTRIKQVFYLRYLNGERHTFDEIGQQLGISKQTAINLLKRGKKILRAKLLSENYVDKI